MEAGWRAHRQASARLTTRPRSRPAITKLTADEGPELGGKDAGPAPYDLLTSALAACTVITLRMYAERKQWPVTAVHADVNYVREGDKQRIDRVLTIEGKVDDEQKKRMADIAERTPVTLTLKGGLEIRTSLSS